MIEFLKNLFTKDETKWELPPFKKVIFHGDNGKQYEYAPLKNITPHQVALLLPMFLTFYPMNRWNYLKENDLMKHFKEVENETK